MTERAQESRTVTGELKHHEDLVLDIEPATTGTITASVTCTTGQASARLQLEIFKSDHSAIESRTIEVNRGENARISFDVTEQQLTPKKGWACRVRNMDSGTVNVTLCATYPGERTLVTEKVSTSLLERVIERLLCGSRLVLERGENGSYFQAAPGLGGGLSRFTVPELTKRVLVMSINQYVNHIESESIRVTFADADAGYVDGAVQIRVDFKHTGNEIGGTFSADVRDLSVRARLGLGVEDGKICYQKVAAEIAFDMSVTGIPDLLVDTIAGYKEKIRRMIADGIVEKLREPDVRGRIGRNLTERLLAVLPQGAVVQRLRVADGMLYLSFA